jgi:hypothetical protein
MKGNGIEFVIAHHGICVAGKHHVADEMQCLTDLRSAVDEIAYKNNLSFFGVAVYAKPASISEFLEQAFQGICMAMNIADDVEVFVNRHIAKLKKKLQGILCVIAVKGC